MRIPLLLGTLAAMPALADSPGSWEAFRARVGEACLAAVQDPGEVVVDVNPFGSESYGVALLEVTTEYGTDRMACIFDKVTGAVEVTSPFAPAADAAAQGQ
jgi:hypothetical protein